jgi:hypothetical protein
MDMMKLFVRIAMVDMNGYNGREHHPTREMEGSFVRVTGVETVPVHTVEDEASVRGLRDVADVEDRRRPLGGEGFRQQADRIEEKESYMWFEGVLVDANGDDIEDGEVELIDHELSCKDDIILTFAVA